MPGPEINPAARGFRKTFLDYFYYSGLRLLPEAMPTRTPRARATDGGARHAAHLRGLNLERVLAVAMDRPGPFTRAELIEATGLSAPTVGSLAADLIRSGVVRDLGTGPSSGGRRPFFMEFNARHGYVAGHRPRPDAHAARGGRPARRADRRPHRRHAAPASAPAALLQRIAAALRTLDARRRACPRSA